MENEAETAFKTFLRRIPVPPSGVISATMLRRAFMAGFMAGRESVAESETEIDKKVDGER